MVMEVECDYMYDEYAMDKTMRINRGIRRRLVQNNDRRRVELLNGLLMSMRGTPIVHDGDEIGMGDKIILATGMGVWMLMQWNSTVNAGFSTVICSVQRFSAIPIPVYGYQAVNCAERSEHSLLLCMIEGAEYVPLFSAGIDAVSEPLESPCSGIRQFGHDIVLVVNNLSSTAQRRVECREPYKGYVPIERSEKNCSAIWQFAHVTDAGTLSILLFQLRRI